MAIEQTFSIIKPNAMKKNAIGDIISMFEANGLKIAAAKITILSKAKAEEFYAEHKERPFFGELVSFMTSGPVCLMCLQGENAVLKNREIMGATDPKKANAGTVRAKFGDNVGENAVHGSDSAASAARELALFFEKHEICNV
ncbi:MAG: nucleoside diphosphate kinase [Bdellovibrio sp. ArHS]|uniref:Nucleoside diphosphate kinase n=1 Tax=Bdellovibrio bacteriovorus TaxID=959 RepID=A0A162GT70_BDEBC|nr:MULTISPECIES: nucleoside-diphosphate kinase [Bdellovibrio]KHD88011.1 MAG: nucleoside diphosphate kinase [Bdellovibrio sp. ArHS]KYG68897.1 nucleoside-diphosphate kinase [Bdellovibrio bacteriovorus]